MNLEVAIAGNKNPRAYARGFLLQGLINMGDIFTCFNWVNSKELFATGDN
jgi:hypothetical protein